MYLRQQIHSAYADLVREYRPPVRSRRVQKEIHIDIAPMTLEFLSGEGVSADSYVLSSFPFLVPSHLNAHI